MQRYLINMSYIGTQFLGAQRQVTRALPRLDDPNTVQGRIEMGLRLLKPTNDPCVVLSSRTDAGVHALHTTCHVDLERFEGVYDPRTLTCCLNRYFQKENLPIRIISTYLVPEDFHCRHRAISRTYLYKTCFVKTDPNYTGSFLQLIPIEHHNRVLYMCISEFDVDKLKKTASLLSGLHDFRTFMGKVSDELNKVTRKEISIEILDGSHNTYSDYSWPESMFNSRNDYNYYDIYIKGKGFLYNQVRRTVGCLIAAAQGKVTNNDIRCMLEIPSRKTWNPRLRSAPAYGLYLCNVEYNQLDRESFRELP